MLYDNPDHEDGFGSLKGRENPHRGFDFIGPAGSPVLAWSSGRIAAIGYSSIIGNYVVVEQGGEYAGYAHLKNIPGQLNLGTQISQFYHLGELAGHDDKHGSAWTGPHLHCTLGPRVTSITLGATVDPWPTIKEALGNSLRKVGDMKLTWDTEGTGYVVTEDGFKGLPSMQYYNLFKRLENSTVDDPDTFNRAEIDMMNSVLTGMSGKFVNVTVDTDKIARDIAAKISGVNGVELAKAISDELAKRLVA